MSNEVENVTPSMVINQMALSTEEWGIAPEFICIIIIILQNNANAILGYDQNSGVISFI